MQKVKSIIWRRLDIAGHEFARMSSERDSQSLIGTAIMVYQSQLCKLDYSIKCAPNWETLSAKISGFLGEKIIKIQISAEAEKVWKLNGEVISEVKDCTDIDLNFSPVTNTLPIRRLNLAVGEKSIVNAAWLRFPGFRLERLEQIYERVDERIYHYESAGGSFTTDIEIDEAGFVVNYPNLWQIEN